MVSKSLYFHPEAWGTVGTFSSLREKQLKMYIYIYKFPSGKRRILQPAMLVYRRVYYLINRDLPETRGYPYKVVPFLGGGFKYFSFSSLFGEDFQFD